MKACFDSNILIDYLNGFSAAGELFASYDVIISAIVYAEVLTGLSVHLDPRSAKEILRGLNVAPVDREIAELAADIRASKKLKMPDALIYATAKHLGVLLLTRNTKDFKESDPHIRIPYRFPN